MIALRSVLFNTIFYANLIIRMIVLSPYYFVVPRLTAYEIPKNWARSKSLGDAYDRRHDL